MFTVQNSALPVVAKSDFGTGVLSTLRNTSQKSGTFITVVPLGTIEETIPPEQVTTVADTSTINLSNYNYSKITTVQIGDVVYKPAADVNNIHPGEFVYDPYTFTLRIKRAYNKNSASVKVIGEPTPLQQNSVENTLLDGLPAIFSEMPLKGSFSWTQGFEQHPQGTIKLQATQDTIDRIEETFLPGQELNFFGVGFRVASFQKVYLGVGDYPLVNYEVSINLDGKWLNKLDKPITYRQWTSPPSATSQAYADSECSVDFNNSVTTDKRKEIPVVEYAQRLGVPFIGNIPEKVKVPKDIPPTATTTLAGELVPRLRQNNAFLIYSQNAALEARDYDSCRLWDFSEWDIKSEVSETRQVFIDNPGEILDYSDLLPKQSDETLPFPSTITPVTPLILVEEDASLNRIPSSAKYKNTEITWDFKKPKLNTPLTQLRIENTQNNKKNVLESQWIRRYPIKETKVTGDPNPELPPEHIFRLNDLSLCYDNGGEGLCKRKITTYLEDSMEIIKQEQVWGFVFTADELIRAGEWLDGSGPEGKTGPNGTPTAYWTIVEDITTYSYYDDGLTADTSTGYYLGSDSFGWKLCRFKTESPQNPETFNHIDSLGNSLSDLDTKFLNLYYFKKIPYRSLNKRGLLPLDRFYKDVDYSESYSLQKVCLRDGTSYLKQVSNPTFVLPMFVAQEHTETICFASCDNPENTPDTFPKLPRYTTGKEEWFRKTIEILASKNTKGIVGTVKDDDREDRYKIYTVQSCPQDPSYKSESNTVNQEIVESRPDIADKRPPLFEFVEPEANQDTEPYTPNEKYFLTTGNFTTQDLIDGSVNYPYATSKESALKAATCELRIKDFTESLQTSFTVPFNRNIKEGDRVVFTAAGRVCRRRVLNINNQIDFLGKLVGGRPMVSSEGTSLTLGIDRDVSKFNLQQHTIPKPNSIANVLVVRDSFKLGEFISGLDLTNRGKF